MTTPCQYYDGSETDAVELDPSAVHEATGLRFFVPLPGSDDAVVADVCEKHGLKLQALFPKDPAQ